MIFQLFWWKSIKMGLNGFFGLIFRYIFFMFYRARYMIWWYVKSQVIWINWQKMGHHMYYQKTRRSEQANPVLVRMTHMGQSVVLNVTFLIRCMVFPIFSSLSDWHDLSQHQIRTWTSLYIQGPFHFWKLFQMCLIFKFSKKYCIIHVIGEDWKLKVGIENLDSKLSWKFDLEIEIENQLKLKLEF